MSVKAGWVHGSQIIRGGSKAAIALVAGCGIESPRRPFRAVSYRLAVLNGRLERGCNGGGVPSPLKVCAAVRAHLVSFTITLR